MKHHNTLIGLVRRTGRMSLAAAGIMTALAACNGGGAGAAGGPNASNGLAAATDDGNFDGIVLSLTYVNFTRDGAPVITQDKTIEVVNGINALYSKCGIRFRLEEIQEVNPADVGLSYNQSSAGIMDTIRAPFQRDNSLVVINTGDWNQSIMGSANAWTAMPGQSPLGAVLEDAVADNVNIAAHELGHYLSLDHVSDQSQLMNPIIYGTSTLITESQCESMRETARGAFSSSIR